MEAMDGPAMHSLISRDCAGEELSMLGGGTWIGHVGPGCLFIIWGLFWAVNIFLNYLRFPKHGNKPAILGRGWFEVELRGLRLLEPCLKVIAPMVGIFIELYGDHSGQYMNLKCKDGTFAIKHLHNWQHAASYPGFLLSGLVDLAGTFTTLPERISQTFLGLAFSTEAFLMLTHTKHEPLDQMVHQFLAYTMVLCAVFLLLEVRFRRSLLISSGKALAMIFQGSWMVQLGRMMYTDSVLWRPEDPVISHGPLMATPIAYAMIFLLCASSLLMLFIIMKIIMERFASEELPMYAEEEDVSLCSGDLSIDDDSANEHSDTEEGGAIAKKRAAGRSSVGSAIQILEAIQSLTRQISNKERGNATGQKKKGDEHVV